MLQSVFTGLAVVAWALGAGDTVTIKPEVYVKGPKVMLGDIAKITGEHAERWASLEVAPAAVPGASKNIDSAYLLSRIKSAGYSTDDVTVVGAPSVKATTRHLEVTGDMLAEDLRRYIQVQMPWDPAHTSVDVAVPPQSLIVPDGDVSFLWQAAPEYRYLGPGAFRGEISVDGQLQKTLLCKATVDTQANVVVAATDISRGKTIVSNDLATEKRSLSSVGESVFQNSSELVGSVARSTIFSGQVIAKRQIGPQKLVARNQLVAVETRAGRLEIHSTARAMSDGYEGDVVTCQNLQSKEQFQGVLRKDGVVVVE